VDMLLGVAYDFRLDITKLVYNPNFGTLQVRVGVRARLGGGGRGRRRRNGWLWHDHGDKERDCSRIRWW